MNTRFNDSDQMEYGGGKLTNWVVIPLAVVAIISLLLFSASYATAASTSAQMAERPRAPSVARLPQTGVLEGDSVSDTPNRALHSGEFVLPAATAEPTDKNKPTSVTSISSLQAGPTPDGENNNPADTGDPVNLHSGEFVLESVDMTIPGRGLLFEFQRSYRSQANFEGPLGYNWDFNYNRRLVRDALNSLMLYDGEGRELRYVDDGDGIYVIESFGYYSQLTENDDGSFTYRFHDGIESHFHPLDGSPIAGRLDRIVEPNGNTIECVYNQNGQLITVLDTLGREITFSYDAEDHLVEVRDFEDRQLLFEYDEHGDLVAVTGTAVGLPATQARVTQYAYLSGYENVQEELNHNLLHIAGPRTTLAAPDLINSYESAPDHFAFDRVIQQEWLYREDGESGIMTLAYEQLSFGLIRTTITDPRGNVTEYEVTAAGSLLKQAEYAQEGLAQVTSYTANPDGETTSITYPEGNQVIFAYNEDNPNRLSRANLLQEVQIPTAGKPPMTTTYTYDETFNQVINETDPAGKTTTYDYDDSGSLITETDALGNTTTYTYDEDGTQTGTTDANENDTESGDYHLARPIPGFVITPTWDSNGFVFQFDAFLSKDVEDSVDELQVRWDWEDDGQYDTLYTTTKTASYEYTNSMPQVVRLEVRDRDNLTATLTTPLPVNFIYLPVIAKGTGSVPANSLYPPVIATSSTPAASQPPLVVTGGSDGNSPTYQRIITETNALAHTTILVYDAYDNLLRETDANGNITTYEYDVFNQLTQMTDALGNTTTYTYDLRGNRTSMTDPNGNTTTYAYDLADRLTVITDTLGNTTTYTYDIKGNLIAETDANGNTTSYEYDEFDQLITVRDALGNESQYQYDGNGNLTIIVNARGYTTTFSYDGFNRLTSETDALGNTTSSGYADNVITRTDDLSQSTLYTYDGLNQLIFIDYPDTNDITYGYDPVGNLTNASNADVNLLYTYDALNRLAGVNHLSHGKTITYTYDAVGNRATMNDPDGGVTTYQYDALNRLVMLTNPLLQVTSFTYDSGGRLIRQDHHNGTYVTYAYDDVNQWLTLSHKNASDLTLFGYTYEYDKVGNRTAVTDQMGNTTTYIYDDLYQLISVTYLDATTVTYAYDAVGNRLALTDPSGTTNYAYDAADQLLSAGTTTNTWDANGNLKTKIDANGTTTYTYNYENQLTSVLFPDGSTNNFTSYPNLVQRLSTTDASGTTINYFYDDLNPLVETDPSGMTLARYTSAGIDNWISMDRNGSTFTYHKDALESVLGLTNASANVATAYEYDAFGTMQSQTGSVTNPYLFTGRRWDAESELYYLRVRQYDSMTGRFISRDPFPENLFNPASLNRYIYVRNNPVKFIEPLGLDPSSSSSSIAPAE